MKSKEADKQPNKHTSEKYRYTDPNKYWGNIGTSVFHKMVGMPNGIALVISTLISIALAVMLNNPKLAIVVIGSVFIFAILIAMVYGFRAVEAHQVHAPENPLPAAVSVSQINQAGSNSLAVQGSGNTVTTTFVTQENNVKQPRFSETVDFIDIHLGNETNTVRLHPNIPWQWHRGNVLSGQNTLMGGGEGEITASFDNGVLFVDADILTRADGQIFRLVRNNIEHRPSGWDMNSNDSALEIVDDQGTPRFQLIYQDAGSALIRGIFQYNGAALFADEDGIRTYPVSEMDMTSYKCSPIFLYPAWKHRGEFAK